MKTVIRYQAEDGATFDTADAAKAHEQLVESIRNAEALTLGTPHKLVDDGKGWVQHDVQRVLEFKRRLLRLAEPLLKSYEWYREENFDSVHPGSIVGRILSDANSPLWGAWSRLMRIDALGREHQQPYYAFNGPLPEHVCVEDRRS